MFSPFRPFGAPPLKGRLELRDKYKFDRPWYTILEVIAMKRTVCIFLILLISLTGCRSTVSTQTLAPSDATDPTQYISVMSPTVPSQTAAPVQTETLPPSTEPGFDPYAIIEAMTVEELVGQLFLARCPDGGIAGTELQTYHLGGYILFGRDFDGQTPDSLRETISGYQAQSAIPMLIAVDEEGGTVCRVSSRSAFRSSRFPSPRALYDAGGLQSVLETEAEKCELLTGLGINVNMAPVCDITTDPNAFMYSRSLGQDPQVTGQYISSVVSVMSSGATGSVLKHFPGYGNNTDTHTGIAVDDRSLETLEAADLIPFQAGIDAGCDAILVSHTVVTCLDDTLPASLSPAVIGYLRSNMGFDGVIVTDDLVMQAITDQYGTGEAAVLAVLAGNDLLCSSEYAIQYTAVLDAVNTGRISIDQIKVSVSRILQWKHELALI